MLARLAQVMHRGRSRFMPWSYAGKTESPDHFLEISHMIGTRNLQKQFAFLLAAFLLLQLLPPSVAGQKASIANRREESGDGVASWRPKISVDLEESVDDVSS